MLTKPFQTVLHAYVPGQAYRAYSKTCPTPTPPPTWSTKYLCGVATHYLLLGKDAAGNILVMGNSTAYLIQYNGKVVLDQHVQEITNKNLTPVSSQLAYEERYCTNVKVYG